MQVKCTSCGASQNIDESQDCSYCGNLIEMQKGKSNFQAITKSEFGNFIMMAETSEEATNYNEAISYYNKILEKDTTYSDAWLGKGNCIIYTSKIGDIRMKEALTYWKNSIKFAEHQEPMQLRVSKEIDSVVQTFFPNILDHYSEFAGLDDSYAELAGRFLILEGGIDFACQICPDEPQFFQTGYDLCEMVINAPGTGASSAQIAAAGSAIFNTLAGNKYSVESDNADWQKANARKKQIKEFGNQINHVKNKYLDGLIRLGVVEEDEVTRYDMPKSEGSKSGCFVITATMGDSNHPIVEEFRNYRDKKLLTNTMGKVFVMFYYKIGPYLAVTIERSKLLRKLSLLYIVKPIYKRLKNNINYIND